MIYFEEIGFKNIPNTPNISWGTMESGKYLYKGTLPNNFSAICRDCECNIVSEPEYIYDKAGEPIEILTPGEITIKFPEPC